MSATPPDCDFDFYGDAFIKDPWPRYARMRALGPVLWMSRLGNFALTRFYEVRAALRDPEVF